MVGCSHERPASASTPQRRRPPSLSDAIFTTNERRAALGERASTAPGVGLPVVGACGGCAPRWRSEVQRCLRQLRADVDAAFDRHQEDLQRSAEQWLAQQGRGWRDASSDGFRSAGSEPRVGIVNALPGQGSQPTTPKIQPPPRSFSSLGCSEAQLRKIVEESRCSATSLTLEIQPLTSPRSVSSTRSSSREHTMRWDSGRRASDDGSSVGGCTLPPETKTSSGTTCSGGPPPRVAWAEPKQPDDSMSGAPTPLTTAWGLPGDISAVTSTRAQEAKGGFGTEKQRKAPWQRRMMSDKQWTRGSFSPLSKRKLALTEANQSLAARVMRSHTYEISSTVFIILNALLVMWETEQRAMWAAAGEPDADNLYFGVASCVFCFIFISDVILRLLAERQYFFLSKERGWNAFDVFVSLTAAAEVAVYLYECAVDSTATKNWRIFLRRFSMLRILRLLEVIRKTRAIRVMRFIRELRLMVFSITGSLKSLFWAVVLMLIILLVFGVFFTDGAIAYCVQHDVMEAAETRDLRKYFGTLSAATVSLYMAMSGGEDWNGLLQTLDPLPSEYRYLFLAFITFAILALMNVVTAVFVGTAMQQSQADRELVVQQELEQKGEFVTLMQQVFDELDTNSSGALSLEEFEKHIEDEKILAYLRTQQIDISQVRTLFTLLDVDCTGEVDIDEFVGGCLRLRGGATSMDLAVLKYQVEWILHNVQTLQKSVGELHSVGKGPQRMAMTLH